MFRIQCYDCVRQAISLRKCKCSHVERGFTLVEILIVLAIFSVLAAVALPTVRRLVSEQKVTNASRSLSAYIDATRRRAITDGRPMGIRIERLDVTPGTASPGRAAALRVRQLRSVPPYSGESSSSVATLVEDTTWPLINNADAIDGIDTALFDPNANQLLYVSAKILNDPSYTLTGVRQPPINIGDRIELPGGHTTTILAMTLDDPWVGPVRVHFDLQNRLDLVGNDLNSVAVRTATPPFPVAERRISGPRNVRYKIHRRPVLSMANPFELQRGLVIDLNYSGVGPFDNRFAPRHTAASPPPPALANQHVDIVFGSDGRVISVNDSAGITQPPTGLIFLCLGETEGVRTDSLLSNDDREPANLLNLDSIWVVITPSTGRVVSSPFASVSSLPTTDVTDPSDAAVGAALNEARFFAFLSDTVDSQ